MGEYLSIWRPFGPGLEAPHRGIVRAPQAEEQDEGHEQTHEARPSKRSGPAGSGAQREGEPEKRRQRDQAAPRAREHHRPEHRGGRQQDEQQVAERPVPSPREKHQRQRGHERLRQVVRVVEEPQRPQPGHRRRGGCAGPLLAVVRGLLRRRGLSGCLRAAPGEPGREVRDGRCRGSGLLAPPFLEPLQEDELRLPRAQVVGPQPEAHGDQERGDDAFASWPRRGSARPREGRR